MTAAFGIKRLGLAVVALAAAGFGALSILSFLMPADVVRDAVKAEIRAVTGLEPVLRGATTVSLFPTGTVRFDDVSLGEQGADGPALTAEHVVARLRFFPFLTGRIEIADVSLVRPTISIIFNPDRSSNWSGHIDARAHPGAGRQVDDVVLGDQDREWHRAARRGLQDRRDASNVEPALAWPSISKSCGHRALLWNNQPLDATISFIDFSPRCEASDRD